MRKVGLAFATPAQNNGNHDFSMDEWLVTKADTVTISSIQKGLMLEIGSEILTSREHRNREYA